MRNAIMTIALVLAALPLAAHAGVAVPPTAPDWVLASGAGSPPFREGHAMAYDAARGRVVLFGGANEYDVFDFGDTWEWDGSAWVERTPAGSPPARFGHAHGVRHRAGARRALRRVRVLRRPRPRRHLGVGRERLGRARARRGPAGALRSTRWRTTRPGVASCSSAAPGPPAISRTRGSGTGAPGSRGRPPRARLPASTHAMAYDGARGRVVLFGGHGFDGSDRYFSDTWEWDGAPGSSGRRRRARRAASGTRWRTTSPRGRIVLFGGYDGDVPLGDTWEWDGGAWVERVALDEPAPRLGHAMAYDAARIASCSSGDSRGALLSTTPGSGTGPGSRRRRPRVRRPAPITRWPTTPRAGASCSSAATRGSRFSATPGSGTGTRGRRGRPQRRRRPACVHAMAYDSARGRVVLFGGYGRSGRRRRHVGVGRDHVDGADARGEPARPLRARDGLRQRAGARGALRRASDGFSFLGDTWEWDGNDWVEAAPAESPAARGYHAMAYDGARARAVLFGGLDALSFSPTPGNGTAANGCKGLSLRARRLGPTMHWPTMPPADAWCSSAGAALPAARLATPGSGTGAPGPR